MKGKGANWHTYILNWKRPEGAHLSSNRCVGFYHLWRKKQLPYPLTWVETVVRFTPISDRNTQLKINTLLSDCRKLSKIWWRFWDGKWKRRKTYVMLSNGRGSHEYTFQITSKEALYLQSSQDTPKKSSTSKIDFINIINRFRNFITSE